MSRCIDCGGDFVRSEKVVQTFGYGRPRVELSALVRVFTCTDCGFSYTGEDGEIARTEAVHQHLVGVAKREGYEAGARDARASIVKWSREVLTDTDESMFFIARLANREDGGP